MERWLEMAEPRLLPSLMAYQVLARKYRPQRFADVAGQAHVTVTLMNALTQGRIAHGYIFSGHRGIGKTTVARILAMALNCRTPIGSEARPTAEPCEICESCTEIRAGNAVDVIEIDAATNRGIDEIRELRDAARYRPARDRYKIYILDEAHQITDAAFNALLKTLEEPPEHIVFMMATTQPEDIPQTVRSRCQHFSFHAVKMVDILSELRGIAERENVGADEGSLSLLAEAGDGSMRDALSIMDQAIASAPLEEGRPRLDAAQIRELMGTVSNSIFERIFQAVDGGRSAEVITVANDRMDAGNSPSQLARQCVRYLRNCLMAKISGVTPQGVTADGGDAELLQISPDERRRAGRTAALFSEEELTRYLQVMLRTFDELGYRQEQRFHFELGLLKLVHLRRLLPMEEVLSALPTASGVKTQLGGRAASAAGVITAAPANTPREPVFAAPTPLSVRELPQDPSRGTASDPPSPSATGSSGGFSPFQLNEARQARPVQPPGAPASPVPTRPALPQQTTAAAVPLARSRDLHAGAISLAAAADDPTDATDEHHNEQPAMRPLEQPRAQQAQALERAPADVLDPLASAAAIAPDPSAGATSSGVAMQKVAVEALLAVKGQSSAAEALDDATWTIADGNVRVETQLSKRMLPMVVNAEAEKIVRAALHQAFPGSRLELVAGAGAPSAAGAPKKVKAARSGSAQAKAEGHPVVQEAQRLFQAEIRKVIDLSDGTS